MTRIERIFYTIKGHPCPQNCPGGNPCAGAGNVKHAYHTCSDPECYCHDRICYENVDKGRDHRDYLDRTFNYATLIHGRFVAGKLARRKTLK